MTPPFRSDGFLIFFPPRKISTHNIPSIASLWLALFVFGFPGFQAVSSAQKASPAVEMLETLQVSAARGKRPSLKVPAAVDVLNNDDLSPVSPGIVLNESFQEIPGIFAQNPFNFAQDLRLSIRGFGARSSFGIRGIKVLVDDIPQTLPDGQTQVDSIDPWDIDRMEILRGPSSSLYGNASGGVVSIFTEQGGKEPLNAGASFLGGEYGLRKTRIKFDGTAGKFNYRVSASHLTLNGFREHSSTEFTQMNGKLLFEPDSINDWMFVWRILRSPRADDPGALTLSEAQNDPRQASAGNRSFDAGEEVDQESLGLRYRRTVGTANEFTLVGHLAHRNFSNKLPFTDGGATEFERLAPGAGIKWDSSGKLMSRPNRFLAGLDFFLQRDDRKRFDNLSGTRGDSTLDQIESVATVGYYIRNDFELGEKWIAVAGARYDWVDYKVEDAFLSDGDQSGSQTLTQWSGTAGLVYLLSKRWSLYGNYSTAFEVPTTTELINSPSGLGGFNSNLKPQQSFSREIGIKRAFHNGFSFNVAAFLIRSEDELIPFELSSSPGRAFFRNAGESKRIGLETKATAELFARASVKISYTLSHFEFDSFSTGDVNFEGKQLPGIPKHRLFASFRYCLPGDGYFQFNLNRVGEIFVDNENSLENPSYVLAHLRLGKKGQIRKLRYSLYFGVSNLFDQNYNANIRVNSSRGRFFEPGAQVNVYGGLDLAYGFLG